MHFLCTLLTSLGAYILVHPLNAYKYSTLLWKGALQTTINRCERLKRIVDFLKGLGLTGFIQ